MSRLKLTPGNAYNGMAREDFLKLIREMGLDFEETAEPGIVIYCEQRSAENEFASGIFGI